MTKSNTITKEGLENLKNELTKRIEQKRPEIKAIIEDMRDKGDLSENDGYTIALEEYESNERKIAELDEFIKTAVIVSKKTMSSKVAIGTRVKLLSNGTEFEFSIVGEAEANPSEGKISTSTPIGKAIVGKAKGEKVLVQLPMGSSEYEIIDIS